MHLPVNSQFRQTENNFEMLSSFFTHLFIIYNDFKNFFTEGCSSAAGRFLFATQWPQHLHPWQRWFWSVHMSPWIFRALTRSLAPAVKRAVGGDQGLTVSSQDLILSDNLPLLFVWQLWVTDEYHKQAHVYSHWRRDFIRRFIGQLYLKKRQKIHKYVDVLQQCNNMSL